MSAAVAGGEAPPWLRAAPDGVEIRAKVIPGASRDRIVGVLGDRLKIAVAAPPEGGKANRAVCALLAGACGIPARAASIAAGAGSPEKAIRLAGVAPAAALAALAPG